MQELINRAKELLADGTVARVLGWKAGDLPYNPEPAYFETEESLKDFVYNGFCGANLSKYMIEASKLEGKTLVCLKPCDTYSFNQLIKEHRVDREKAYIIGVGCKGKLDIERIRKQGIKGIESISGAEITDEAETLTIQTIYGEKTCAYKDAMLERCHVCKGKEHKIYDELIGESKDTKDADRFAEVEKIEAMSPEEKFAFVHNHNVASGFSEADMTTLLKTENIPMMIAVRNDGVKYIAERKGERLKGVWFDELYEAELKELNELSRSGKITSEERSLRREEVIVECLLRDYTKGLVEVDGRK